MEWLVGLVSIMWIVMGILSVIHINDSGGALLKWSKVPLYVKLLFVLAGPILLIVFERRFFFRKK